MEVRDLVPLYEGSWALMLDELAIMAHKTYGSTAGLDINYYLSIGSGRYYKAYLDNANVAKNRDKLTNFLYDEAAVNDCISKIYKILEVLNNVEDQYNKLDVHDKFRVYCDYSCEYLGYYNSVASDVYCQNVFDIVSEAIPNEFRFASRMIKESLFATDNSDLLTHKQSVDWLRLITKNKNGTLDESDVRNYVNKYKSITTSSGSPQGLSVAEVKDILDQYSASDENANEAFVKNLSIRYANSKKWSNATAESLSLSNDLMNLIKHVNKLSHLRMLMRESFQQFKEITKRNFLSALISEIGKSHFDYMIISEINDYLSCKKNVSESVIQGRKENVIFELCDNEIKTLNSIPPYVNFLYSEKQNVLLGETIQGSGIKRYIVKKVEQDEKGLVDFDKYIGSTNEKGNIVIITDTLKPFLVPKIKPFGALATQHGGFTSHAAVLCHELGIKSVIGVSGLMNSLRTNDCVEINFNNGTIHKASNLLDRGDSSSEVFVDLSSTIKYSSCEVGNKAANLIDVNEIVKLPRGFVLTQYALNNINDTEVKQDIISRIKSLNCDYVAIRSSHESEDSRYRSYAGMFKSYTNIKTDDSEKIMECIESVYSSKDSETIKLYSEKLAGNMFVIIQEMIDADVSGVILSSKPNSGYDYLLVDYFFDSLNHIMDGAVTPYSSYIRKIDIINEQIKFNTFTPPIIDKEITGEMVQLAQMSIKLEKIFSYPIEIEWGIRNKCLYLFQVRPY